MKATESREYNERFPTDDLVPYERNTKKHPASQIKVLAANMARGWNGPPIIIDENNVILAGHGRRLAAIELGLAFVPVLINTGMTEDEKRLYRINDNRMSDLGVNDTEMLSIELSSLMIPIDELSALVAMDDLELKKIMGSFDIDSINLDEVVGDLLDVTESVTASTSERIAEVDGAQVSIDKALGFKHITVEEQRAISKFMMMIEGSTGLDAKDAFVAFAKKQLEAMV